MVSKSTFMEAGVQKIISGIDDLFTSEHIQIDERLVKNPDEYFDVFKYNNSEDYQTWQKENADAGRIDVICTSIEFLHQAPDDDVLNEGLERISEYLSKDRKMFSNIAAILIPNAFDTAWTYHFDIACDFRNNDILSFLDTVATIYGVLMYIHDKHTITDPVRFNRYEITFFKLKSDNRIYRLDGRPFEEIIFQLRNTFRMKQADDMKYIQNGLECTHFFEDVYTSNPCSKDAAPVLMSDILRKITNWVYKQQERKRKIALKYRISDEAKSLLIRSNVLSVYRGQLI